MNLTIVWDWDVPPFELFSDKQGKIQAWRKLGEKHVVTLITVNSAIPIETRVYHDRINHIMVPRSEDIPAAIHWPDLVMCWGSLDRPSHMMLAKDERMFRLVLQFAGGSHDGPELEHFDAVVCQNECDADIFKSKGKLASVIFGVDKDFWIPDPSQDIIYKSIYPASFCTHKGNGLVAQKYRDDCVLVGKWDQLNIVDECRSYGALVLPNVRHDVLRELYRASARLSIGAWAGSQRTVAEAISMNLEIELLDNNPKCQEILDGKVKIMDVAEMADAYETVFNELLNGALND